MCKKRALLVARGATQLAGHLNVLDSSARKWLLRATHNSDEVRNPSAKRLPARSTARRPVRGSPSVEMSEGQRTGKETSSRPDVAFPEGAPT